MSKEEIALELAKLSYVEHLKTKKTPHDFTDVKKEVTGLYNYIYENLKLEEPSK